MLIDENDQPQVTDFGLAKRLDGESSLTLNEAIQQVVTQDPVTPRLLNPGVPRDLQTVCLKCLEKEPERRYPTAAALALELGRFLNGEPTIARPLGPLGRAWRWCRRKPLVAGLWATTVAAVAGGLVLALLGLATARQEARAALRSAQKSNRVAELLRELIATAEPAAGKRQDFTVREMLDTFSADLEHLLADDPEVEVSVRTALASAYLELYEVDTAWIHLARALALVKTHLSANALEAAIVFQTVGQYYSLNEQTEEAWPYFLRAQPILRRELTADHFRLLHLKTQLAIGYRDAGDSPPAYELLHEAVALTRRKAGERDADVHRAHALRFLAGMYRLERRFDEARASIAEWRQALAPHFPAAHQLLLLADFQEALLFRGQARSTSNAALFEQAIAGFNRVLDSQLTALPEEHVDTLETRLELARTHFYAGHTDAAVRLILDAYEAAHRKVGPDHPMTRKVLAALEQIREATGRPELDTVGRDEPAKSTP